MSGGREQRKFKRWTVSIPCSVQWNNTVIEAAIDNLSYGGARITDVKVVPPEGVLVTVKFQLEEEAPRPKTALTAKVVYATRSVFEGQVFNSLGVEFQDPLKKVTSKLTPLFLRLRRRELENSPKHVKS